MLGHFHQFLPYRHLSNEVYRVTFDLTKPQLVLALISTLFVVSNRELPLSFMTELPNLSSLSANPLEVPGHYGRPAIRYGPVLNDHVSANVKISRRRHHRRLQRGKVTTYQPYRNCLRRKTWIVAEVWRLLKSADSITLLESTASYKTRNSSCMLC